MEIKDQVYYVISSVVNHGHPVFYNELSLEHDLGLGITELEEALYLLEWAYGGDLVSSAPRLKTVGDVISLLEGI